MSIPPTTIVTKAPTYFNEKQVCSFSKASQNPTKKTSTRKSITIKQRHKKHPQKNQPINMHMRTKSTPHPRCTCLQPTNVAKHLTHTKLRPTPSQRDLHHTTMLSSVSKGTQPRPIVSHDTFRFKSY